MTKDLTIESHIADSKTKIEKARPNTIDIERRIGRGQQALERSRRLLEEPRDPLELGELIGESAPADRLPEDRPRTSASSTS
jgi:hypothetical protein